jgi:hypothetical protein
MSQAVRHNSDNWFLPVKVYFKSYFDLETAVFGFRISAVIPDPEGVLGWLTL